MNKEKLISLIIRKQTYKDTKPYLNELGIGKETAAKVSAEAVRDILTTDYIAEAKLYAVRYLKDAFEKGNTYFITLVESSILPILTNIAADEADDKAVTKYAGSSYTKTEQLSKFKSILSSLFRISKECIRKWAQWIPDSNKKFIGALAELNNKKVSLDFDYKYFREENDQYFKEYCQKNGVKLTGNGPSTGKSVNPASSKKKDPLQDAVQSALLKVDKAKNIQDLSKLQNDFNEALNNYLQNAADFKEDLVQKWFDEIQKKKTDAASRFEGKKKGQKPSNVAPAPTGATPNGAKSQQKISNEDSKNANQKNKKISNEENIGAEKNIEKTKVSDSNSSKKVISSVGSERRDKEAKSEKPVTVSNEPNIVINSPKQLNTEKGSPKVAFDIKQQHHQDELLKQKKSSKASKPVSKGPLIFDDDIQQQFFKPPQTNKSQSHKKSEPFQRSKPQMLENRPIKPTGEESRSPKATEISKSSKQIEQSKSSKLSSEVKSRPRTKQEARSPTFNIPTQGTKVGNILNDISASKEDSRIQFSEEEQSEYSEESPHQQGQNSTNFKKQKQKLASIEEENYSNVSENKSGLTMPPVRSRISEEKASVANKLLQENKHLYEKLDKLSKDFEVQKEARVSLAKQRQHLEKQLSIHRENEQRIIKKLKVSVPLEDYNMLKRQLQKERENQSKLHEQNLKLKASHQSLIQQLNETKQRLHNLSLQDRSKIGGAASYLQGGSDRSIKQKSQIASKNLLGSRILKEQVDQDYVRNATHPSNMHNWLSQVNIALFKRNVLNLSDIFYRDEYLTILSKSNVYTQNDKQFLSLIFTFQFKSMKQITPAIRYKNCQQLDLWTKPLTGDQLLYTQELVVGLHRNPIKILKAQLKIIEGLVIKFLLPFMYVNFLREEAFSSEQFQEIFAMKAEQLLKSKIVVLNTNTIKEPQDFKRIFKSAQVSADNKIRFCLSEGISDCIFMSQIQMLRNNKAILRILPIPASESMNMKARQLLDDLVFLIS